MTGGDFWCGSAGVLGGAWISLEIPIETMGEV